ncbi:YjgF/Yer057p/UK114 family [Penicillium frequentans]|uniref:YjgF/Yer057p/UK114 family n=1 Tax=Penicillium frequentans TaxID=3151616 RepID=A0AAD6D5Y0_9EURO|nr:YjgF/Yer057p/UK114 family [Penicillium glabrum]
MSSDGTSSKLVSHGLRFCNHSGEAGQGAADLFGLSNAVVVPFNSDRVIVGGNIGLRPDGTMPSSLEEEVDQVFKNIAASLQAAGLGNDSLQMVYKVTTYQYDGEPAVFDTLNAIARKYFGATKPSWTAVIVKGLLHPEAHVEIEVEAFIPKSKL